MKTWSCLHYAVLDLRGCLLRQKSYLTACGAPFERREFVAEPQHDRSPVF